METFTVTQIRPEGAGLKRHVEGLRMSGSEVAAALDDPSTCEDIIHEDDCEMRAVECWHLRPYLPKEMRDKYDDERAAAAPALWRHPAGLVWFRI